ncbi:MAG: tRNA pseudouridine(55) synthase TruB [Candidatus Zixiibacteriota bacterium]|nr:MAG: tRNA pseudouridine(55) synthase TruB [candidate division Zixibacteria bacterium]
MIQYDGILLCKKPFGISSHEVINRLRQIIGQKKIGHTGTLDPRATGLLVICLGRATKVAQFLEDMDKAYEVEIKLGVSSSTFDAEGVTDDTQARPVPELTKKQVIETLSKFKGKIKQKVPAYSAAKVNGRRLYKLARLGHEVETPEREVDIKDIALTELDLPFIRCLVSCSKGTYIRSLANDVGERIGCGAYLSKLSRTRVGSFVLTEALSLNEIRHYREAGVLKRHIKPIESILRFPSLKVTEDFSRWIVAGRSPRLKDIANVSGDFGPDDLISLKDHTGRIMAVGRAVVGSGELRDDENKNFFTYVRVFN